MSGCAADFGVGLQRVFFGRGGIVNDIPHARRDGPVESQCHDQDEASQAIGALDLAILLVLKSENMGSMPHLSPWSKARCTMEASEKVVIQGSGLPAS
jgi:hypothetical protein